MSKREYERGKGPDRYDSDTSTGSFVVPGNVVW